MGIKTSPSLILPLQRRGRKYRENIPSLFKEEGLKIKKKDKMKKGNNTNQTVTKVVGNDN